MYSLDPIRSFRLSLGESMNENYTYIRGDKLYHLSYRSFHEFDLNDGSKDREWPAPYITSLLYVGDGFIKGYDMSSRGCETVLTLKLNDDQTSEIVDRVPARPYRCNTRICTRLKDSTLVHYFTDPEGQVTRGSFLDPAETPSLIQPPYLHLRGTSNEDKELWINGTKLFLSTGGSIEDTHIPFDTNAISGSLFVDNVLYVISSYRIFNSNGNHIVCDPYYRYRSLFNDEYVLGTSISGCKIFRIKKPPVVKSACKVR